MHPDPGQRNGVRICVSLQMPSHSGPPYLILMLNHITQPNTHMVYMPLFVYSLCFHSCFHFHDNTAFLSYLIRHQLSLQRLLEEVKQLNQYVNHWMALLSVLKRLHHFM